MLNNLEDTYLHKGQRKKLIDSLRQKGISNEKVLEAMLKIPRHFFMNKDFESFAYKDQAFPINAGQTISQPYTVAFQTQLLDVQKNDKILEIGTGSGYQTSVLLEMNAIVYSIERQKELHILAKKNLSNFSYYPNLYYGDGYKGLPAHQPFDKILITAAAPYISENLKSQLKINGKIVVPLGEGNTQKMVVITKLSENNFEEKYYGTFAFVRMLKGIE